MRNRSGYCVKVKDIDMAERVRLESLGIDV